jgi:hypothetical protein
MTAKATKPIKFRTTLLSAGKTATGIEVPPSVVESLGAGKKPPVRVTINGYTYRSTVAVMGGKFMIGVSAENRGNAGVHAGQELEVGLELDTEPRVVTVPDDFQQALNRDAKAKAAFGKLSYSNQLRHVLAIKDAKTPETRQRRIEKAIQALKEGK